MPEYRIHHHAVLRERLGSGSEVVTVPDEPVALGRLIEAWAHAHPEAAALLPALSAAVNETMADALTPVRPADRIDLFPPFGGG